MKKIDLEELKTQYKDSLFCELIGVHVREKKTKKLQEAGMGTALLLPFNVRPLIMDFLDFWNNKITYNPIIWHTDTSLVLSMITGDAWSILKENGIEADDETLFNMFQSVVLNFAHAVSTQPKMQKFLGIKKKLFGLF